MSVMVEPVLADSHASNQLAFTKGPGWSKGEHTHPVHIIVTMIVGRMEFIIAGQRFVVEPGDELLYPAHAVHSARNLHDGASHMMESSKR